jgi:hypothetical protein
LEELKASKDDGTAEESKIFDAKLGPRTAAAVVRRTFKQKDAMA